MNESPLVTVYITTKNRCNLLKRAIDSVLNQTYKNIELIVCDDASNDNTAQLLADYAARHDNLSYFSQSHSQGACVLRNKAAKMASGKYITGLDDDDYFVSDRIEVLVNAFDEKYSFICSAYIRQTAQKKRIVKDGVGLLSLSDMLHYNKVGNQVFTLTSRFLSVGGFDESLPAFQDYDMWIRLIVSFGDCYKLSQPLYVFDISKNHERISNDRRKVITGYQKFFSKHNNKMTSAHLNSMKLLENVVSGKKLDWLSAIKWTNRGNYKSIISQLIKD
ncbi:glycosyltransferase [Thalassomonas haliotis]|uniref:Glycosyltransferase n=1 Tax=Thalassomonas haliotis TaxID=485448 RepID=A0ABY7VIJ8_9GAMM|nr:glycosyltransferase [Thalassomonas haliotis]WDE13281.1 glycosyltransferase [Thalassomonas haliotis]